MFSAQAHEFEYPRYRIEGNVYNLPAWAVEHRDEFPTRGLPHLPAVGGMPHVEEHLCLFLEAEHRQYIAIDSEHFQSTAALLDYQPERSAFHSLPFHANPRHYLPITTYARERLWLCIIWAISAEACRLVILFEITACIEMPCRPGTNRQRGQVFRVA